MNVPDAKKNAIASSTVFASIPERYLDDIAAHAEIRDFAAGQALFSAGDAPASMYFIVSGEFSVLRLTESGEPVEIARLASGDSMGEIEMISNTPRTVTVKAESDAAVVAFPSPGLSFTDFLASSPESGARVLYALVGDIASRTRRADAALKENAPLIQELRKQIYEDKTTGLRNKIWLEETLPRMLEFGRPLALIMLKPDNFKQVCDTAGHDAGSNLLALLAARLPAMLPEGAPLARYAGNEFAVVLADAGKDEALAVAARIRDFYNGLDISSVYPEKGFRLTVSLGVSLYPDFAQSADGLIEGTKSLPLAGRARGGNRILFAGDPAEASA